MPLRDLENTEMVTVTQTMADPQHDDHKVLAANPMIRGLMPELLAAHNDILATKPDAAVQERLGEIQAEQEVADGGFDNGIRGMWYRFRSEEYLAKDPDVAQMFRDLRRFFVPDGLQMTNLSYRQEVGHAAMVAANLTARHKDVLRKLKTYDSDMHAEMTGWLGAARRLGELDHERTGILPEPSGMTPSQNLKARNRWIRIVDLIRQVAAMQPEDEELDEIMGRVRKVEEQAGRRRMARAAARSNPPDTDADEAPDTDAAPDTDEAPDTDAAPDAALTA